MPYLFLGYWSLFREGCFDEHTILFVTWISKVMSVGQYT